MKKLVGMLLSTGMKLDDILDLTYPQMALVGEMIMIHKGEMLDALLSPLVNMLPDAKYKKAKVEGGKTARSNKKKKTGKSDDNLLMQMAVMGVPIKTKQ